MSDQRQSQETDRLVEEFRMLVDAVARRAEEYLHRLHVGSDASATAATPDSDASDDRCPVCQLLAVLRGQGGQAAGTVLERLTVLIAALRQAMHEQPSEDEEPDPEQRPVQRVAVQRVSGTVLGQTRRSEAAEC